jgi:hypothetical protein
MSFWGETSYTLLTFSCHAMCWSGSSIISRLKFNNRLIHRGKAGSKALIVLNCLISSVINRFHRVVLRYLRGYRLRLGWNIVAVHVLSPCVCFIVFWHSEAVLLYISDWGPCPLFPTSEHSVDGRLHSLHSNLLHLHALSLLQSTRDSSLPLFKYLLCQIILCYYVSFRECSSALYYGFHTFHLLRARRSNTWCQDCCIGS